MMVRKRNVTKSNSRNLSSAVPIFNWISYCDKKLKTVTKPLIFRNFFQNPSYFWKNGPQKESSVKRGGGSKTYLDPPWRGVLLGIFEKGHSSIFNSVLLLFISFPFSHQISQKIIYQVVRFTLINISFSISFDFSHHASMLFD